LYIHGHLEFGVLSSATWLLELQTNPLMFESNLNQRFSEFFLLLPTSLFCHNIAVSEHSKNKVYILKGVLLLSALCTICYGVKYSWKFLFSRLFNAPHWL